MKKDFLNRYTRTPDGRFIIDVATGRIEDLFNNFDRVSPYNRKDLDENLVEYLVESGREIDPAPCLIRISLDRDAAPDIQQRIRHSIANYFTYLIEVETLRMMDMVRKSLILLALGLVLIALSVVFNRQFEDSDSVLARVVAEGITVAAWVSLWESVATFLIHWSPHQRDKRLFRHLASVPVEFSSAADQPGAPANGGSHD